MGKRYADPFGDVGPALFTGEVGNLAAPGMTPEFWKRERAGTCNQAIYLQSPIDEAGRLMALEDLVLGRISIREGRIRNLAAVELAGQRMPREQSLGGVGERLPGTVKAAPVGRDQAVLVRELGGDH